MPITKNVAFIPFCNPLILLAALVLPLFSLSVASAADGDAPADPVLACIEKFDRVLPATWFGDPRTSKRIPDGRIDCSRTVYRVSPLSTTEQPESKVVGSVTPEFQFDPLTYSSLGYSLACYGSDCWQELRYIGPVDFESSSDGSGLGRCLAFATFNQSPCSIKAAQLEGSVLKEYVARSVGCNLTVNQCDTFRKFLVCEYGMNDEGGALNLLDDQGRTDPVKCEQARALWQPKLSK